MADHNDPNGVNSRALLTLTRSLLFCRRAGQNANAIMLNAAFIYDGRPTGAPSRHDQTGDERLCIEGLRKVETIPDDPPTKPPSSACNRAF